MPGAKYPSTRLPDPANLITVDEAMARYGVSRGFLYCRIHDGSVTRFKIGRLTRLDVAECDRAIIRRSEAA